MKGLLRNLAAVLMMVMLLAIGFRVQYHSVTGYSCPFCAWSILHLGIPILSATFVNRRLSIGLCRFSLRF